MLASRPKTKRVLLFLSLFMAVGSVACSWLSDIWSWDVGYRFSGARSSCELTVGAGRGLDLTLHWHAARDPDSNQTPFEIRREIGRPGGWIADNRRILSFKGYSPEWLELPEIDRQHLDGPDSAYSSTRWRFVLPYWLAIGIFGAPPLIAAIRRRRERRLAPLRDRKCPRCGYDVRATPDRCPECGAWNPADWNSPRERFLRGEYVKRP